MRDRTNTDLEDNVLTAGMTGTDTSTDVETQIDVYLCRTIPQQIALACGKLNLQLFMLGDVVALDQYSRRCVHWVLNPPQTANMKPMVRCPRDEFSHF